MWLRYRFKTKSVEDYRPLKVDERCPWWCTGTGEDCCTIVIYLPPEKDLKEFWDDAYDVTYEECTNIEFTSRFPKPDWYKE